MDREAQENDFPQAEHHAQLPDDGHGAAQPEPPGAPHGYQRAPCPNCGASLLVREGEVLHV